MSLDLFQQEASDRLTAMPPVQNVDAGMFDGFVRGTGLATMKGFAKAGRAIDLLGSIGPIVQDTFTSGTEAQDKYFREHDAVYGRAVDYWTPRSTEIGSAAEVMGTLLSVIPQVIASPSLAVATTQLGTAEDLVNVGVTSGKANIVGAIQGAGLGVGIWMPILGQNLWQRALIGGAGFNMVQGVATRAASGVILNDTPAKDMFKAFDGEAMTLDALLGMAFGSLAHLSPQQRAQGKEVWGRIQTWAENLSPGEKAAISTLREGEHLNVDSTPGRPVQAADIQAHVERMRTAIDQLATDQPVAVEDITVTRRVPEEVEQIPQLREELEAATTSRGAALEAGDQATATRWNGEIERLNRELTDKSTIVAEDAKKPAEQQPRFEPDPERIKEAEATMQTLVDQAQVVRAEEGLPPPPEEAPRVTQSVRRTIEEELARAGRPAEEAAAGAALWDAFYTTMAKRIGMTAAQLWERFPLARITNELPGGEALKQGSDGQPMLMVGKQLRAITNADGRRIAADVEQLKAFWNWFKDSKVVAQDGKPLIAYHHTNADIATFKPGATWFTGRRGEQFNRAVEMPVYLKMEKPYRTGDQYEVEEGPNDAAFMAKMSKGGYDGIIYADPANPANGGPGQRDMSQFVVFKPTQIKSAIGNRGTFDPRSPNILFQNQRRDTWYTSALGEGIAKLNMKAAPAKGWLDALKGLGSKGVKADEVKWSGLEEWLQMQDGRITKEQVQEFLTNNGVKVEEVMLGGKGAPNLADPRIADDVEMVREHGFTPEQSPDDASMLAFNDLENGDIITSEEIANYANDNPELRPVAEAALRVERYWYGGNRTELMTKYGTYQLPGGENYRELLLTLPEKTTPKAKPEVKQIAEHSGEPVFEVSMGNTRASISHNPGFPWRVDYDGGESAGGFPTSEAAIAAATRRVEQMAGWTTVEGDGGGANFQSSHFDQTNILAHIRFNERTDADGKRVLFIEEFQSDWAQKGKRGGFNETTPGVFGGTVQAKPGTVPAAPFVGKTDAWVGLALKRMIAYAAENGFDRVAWTRGEHADAINDWRVAVPKMLETRKKVVDTTEKEDALSDAIGKAMAEKIIGDPNQSGTIEGDGIRIDSTGMAGFYDKIVPKVANEVLKKLGGGKVGETTIPETAGGYVLKFLDGEYRGEIYSADANAEPVSFKTEAEARAYAVENGMPPMEVARNTEGTNQQSFNITPAMKAKVEGGLPLFQKTKGTERGYMSMGEEGRVIGLLEGADASTFVHESGHFFLDTMAEIGRLPDVPAAVRADLDTALTWMGVKDPAKWPEMSLDEKRPYHEKFARGFEQYLRDGEAPSPELKGVFQRFRDWLVELYKSAKSLNVKLNDDIRGVLNRMLADQVSNPSTEAPLAPAARAVPPPPLGEGGEAPAGAEVRLIDQPAIRDTLQRMADDEVGWAQIGGRLLDQSQLGSGKPSFSIWIPKAEWWRDRPDKKMNGPQAQTAVRKALAGEKLKPIEQRIVDHMLEMADERLRGVDRVGGEEEYQALGIDAWDEGLEPSTVNLVDLDLAARAAAIDEAYVERAAIKYENDDAAFRGELEMLIYEHEAKQAAEIAGRSKAGEQPAPGEKPAAGKKAGPADLVRNEADLIVEKNPEMPITVGINPDGTPMTMSAREFLDTARAEAELNRQDVNVLEVAAQCLLGVF